MGMLRNLFGGAEQAQAPPPAAMPPSLADPVLYTKAASKRAAAMNSTVATSAKGLTKPPTVAPVSLLGG